MLTVAFWFTFFAKILVSVNWYSSDLSLHFLNNTIWFRNKQEKISESDVRHGTGFDHPLPPVYITESSDMFLKYIYLLGTVLSRVTGC
jgi:hypothetical protein